MRKRFTRNSLSVAVLSLSTAFWANGVSALGLGDIDLKSALDQKLDAEIQLLEVRDLSKDEILVGLAEQAAFDRQGVERSYFLTNIKFEVDLNARGGPVVRLRSDQPVREPFIDFILEARWPSGKLLREYTVLLDLPVYAEDTPAPVAPVQTETLLDQTRQSSSSTSSKTDATTYNNPRSSFDEGRSASQSAGSQSTFRPSYTGDSYRVQSNDTLWEIALDVRPDSSVSVHQTMIALHRANPEAFINGNINLLKAGKVLRVPEQDEIRTLNARDAVRQVAQHNQDWHTGDEAAPLEASDVRTGTAVQQSRGEGRLSLVSPEDSYAAQAGRVSGGDAESSSASEALKQELAATQETLDKTRGENQDLQTKVDSLEEQIRTLESMIEISNESLRAMELAAAKGEQVELSAGTETAKTPSQEAELVSEAGVDDAFVAAESEGAVTEESVVPEDPSVAEESASIEESTSETLAEENTVEESEPDAVQPQKDPSKVVYSAPKKQSSFFDLIKEYFLFIGLGVLAVGAGIFFFLKKRKEDDEFDDFLDQDYEYAADEQVDGSTDDDSADVALADEAMDDVVSEDNDDDIGADEGGLNAEAAEPETEDVVAESDIYIAYGKYDQAEDMLLKALKAKPEHHEARLKLLEICATQGNIDGFDPNYAALISGGAASSLVSRAELLRENIADAPDFDASMYAGEEGDAVSVDEGEAFDEELSEDLDLDLGDDDSDDTELNLAAIDFEPEPEEALAQFEEDDALGTEADTTLAELESESDVLDDLDEAEPNELPDIELSDDLEAADDEDSVAFDLDGLEFETSPELAEDALDDIDEVVAAEGIDLAEDFDLSKGVSATIDIETDDASEFDLAELEAVEPLPAEDDLDISESELSAPSLQDELETDLGAIDFDLDGLEDVSEEIETAEIAEADEPDLAEEADLGELELADDSSAGEESDDASVSAVAFEQNAIEEQEPELAFDADETLIRDSFQEQSDELPDVAGDLDLESLDAELDELSADLDESSLSQGEFANLDAELDANQEDAQSDTENTHADKVIDADDPATELSEPDDLDATLAEGEQMLADLEGALDESEIEASDSRPSEPVAFDSFDTDLEDLSVDNDQVASLDAFDAEFTEESDELAESSDEVTEFEEFDLGDPNTAESDSAVQTENAFEQFESFDEAADENTSADSVASSETAESLVEQSDTEETASASSDADALGFELPDIDPEATDDSDLDFLSSSDEISTKLDLAAAYVDMGDASGAREILEEVLAEGSDDQKSQANTLLERLSD